MAADPGTPHTVYIPPGQGYRAQVVSYGYNTRGNVPDERGRYGSDVNDTKPEVQSHVTVPKAGIRGEASTITAQPKKSYSPLISPSRGTILSGKDFSPGQYYDFDSVYLKPTGTAEKALVYRGIPEYGVQNAYNRQMSTFELKESAPKTRVEAQHREWENFISGLQKPFKESYDYFTGVQERSSKQILALTAKPFVTGRPNTLREGFQGTGAVGKYIGSEIFRGGAGFISDVPLEAAKEPGRYAGAIIATPFVFGYTAFTKPKEAASQALELVKNPAKTGAEFYFFGKALEPVPPAFKFFPQRVNPQAELKFIMLAPTKERLGADYAITKGLFGRYKEYQAGIKADIAFGKGGTIKVYPFFDNYAQKFEGGVSEFINPSASSRGKESTVSAFMEGSKSNLYQPYFEGYPSGKVREVQTSLRPTYNIFETAARSMKFKDFSVKNEVVALLPAATPRNEFFMLEGTSYRGIYSGKYENIFAVESGRFINRNVPYENVYPKEKYTPIFGYQTGGIIGQRVISQYYPRLEYTPSFQGYSTESGYRFSGSKQERLNVFEFYTREKPYVPNFIFKYENNPFRQTKINEFKPRYYETPNVPSIFNFRERAISRNRVTNVFALPKGSFTVREAGTFQNILGRIGMFKGKSGSFHLGLQTSVFEFRSENFRGTESQVFKDRGVFSPMEKPPKEDILSFSKERFGERFQPRTSAKLLPIMKQKGSNFASLKMENVYKNTFKSFNRPFQLPKEDNAQNEKIITKGIIGIKGGIKTGNFLSTSLKLENLQIPVTTSTLREGRIEMPRLNPPNVHFLRGILPETLTHEKSRKKGIRSGHKRKSKIKEKTLLLASLPNITAYETTHFGKKAISPLITPETMKLSQLSMRGFQVLIPVRQQQKKRFRL